MPKITHSVCWGYDSRLKQPSMTRKRMRHKRKGKKTVNPNNSAIKAHLNIWDLDVTDINCWFWSQMGARPLFLCPGMRRKFQGGTLLGLRSSLASLSNCGSPHSAANIKRHFIQRTYTHKQAKHSCCKGYSEKSNADADISQTCQMHMCSVDEKCFYTTPMVKSTISLSSENQLWKNHAVPVTDDFANIKTEKAAIDVFQVPWITSIDSFDRSGKLLFCNGRRFWGRWVFPFCNILRAKLGTETLRTEGCWLGQDNGTSSEPQWIEEQP